MATIAQKKTGSTPKSSTPKPAPETPPAIPPYRGPIDPQYEATRRRNRFLAEELRASYEAGHGPRTPDEVAMGDRWSGPEHFSLVKTLTYGLCCGESRPEIGGMIGELANDLWILRGSVMAENGNGPSPTEIANALWRMHRLAEVAGALYDREQEIGRLDTDGAS